MKISSNSFHWAKGLCLGVFFVLSILKVEAQTTNYTKGTLNVDVIVLNPCGGSTANGSITFKVKTSNNNATVLTVVSGPNETVFPGVTIPDGTTFTYTPIGPDQAGSYDFIIHDNLNAINTFLPVHIPVSMVDLPDIVINQVTLTNNSNCTIPNGQVRASISGGSKSPILPVPGSFTVTISSNNGLAGLPLTGTFDGSGVLDVALLLSRSGLPGGTYHFLVKDDYSVCSQTQDFIITDPSPTAYAVSTSTPSVCIGSTGTVGLANSETGVVYEIYLGGVLGAGTGITQTGTTGSSLSFTIPTSILTAAGNYDFAIRAVNGNCSPAFMTGIATITVKALPVATISYAGTPFCATGTANVTQTGQAGGTYSSTAGLVINGATGQINLATSAAGPYTVTYSFTNGTCPSTTTTGVTIKALPVVSTPSAKLCIGSTMNLSPNSGGTWVSNNPGVATVVAGTGVATGVSVGSVTFTFTNTATTCSNTTSAVTVNALPVVSTPSANLCIGSTMNLSPNSGGTWVSNNPGVATVVAGTGVATGVSVGSVTFTFTNTATTCSSTTSAVTVNALPVATISYAGTPFCATGTANVTRTGQAGGTYSSTVGLVIDITTGQIDLAASTAGPYTVTYSFTNGTCPSTTTTGVTIKALPVVSTPSANLCIGSTMNLSPNSGGTWVSNNPGVATVVAGTGVATGVSVGSVTFTFTNTATTCSNTTSAVTVNALPVATISYAGTPFCATGTANVTRTGQAGGTYSSTVGLVIDITTGQIDLAASTAGPYTVTYSFTNGTCPSTTTTGVTIKALPVVSTPSAKLCIGSTMNLSPNSGGTWVSNNPGVATVVAGTGVVTGVSVGSVTFTFTNTATTCSNTTSAVTVNALPVVSTPSANLCIGSTMNLSPNSGGTWVSNNPGVATVVAGTGVATGVSVGSVTFTFTNTATTCSSTTSAVTVNALPVATISYAGTPFCATGTANVTRTGQAGGTYSSTVGLVIDITTGQIDLATSTAGPYTVTYSFTNGTCPSTTTTGVTIKALPVVSTPSANLCIGSTMNLSPNSGGTWVSNNPGVATVVAGTGVATGVSVGSVTFTFTNTATTCSNTTSAVTVNALPVATISYAGTPFCATGTANVTRTGQAGGTYSSTVGLVIDITTGQIDLAASTAGPYTVTYSFTNGTCPSTTTTGVTIKALPVVSTPSANLCIGSTMNLSPNSGGTWVSNNPGVATVVAGTGVATGVSVGSVTFTFTNTVTTCSNTTSAVTVNALPIATISYAGTPFCATGTANVTRTGQAGGTYSSTVGLVIDITTGQIDLAASTAGPYTVTYSFTNGTCPSTTTTGVTIKALPVVSTPSANLCIGSTMNLSPNSGGTWVSNNPGVATVVAGTGVATGVSVGSVTFTFTNTVTTCSNTTSAVTVNALPVVSTPSAKLCIGSTMNLSPNSGGTWVSNNPGVATVVAGTGVVTGVSVGSVTFTFTNTATTCSSTTSAVTVNALPVVSTPSANLCIGSTMNLTPNSGGTWVSNNPGVATVVAGTGVVTGVSAGSVTFTFTDAGTTCSSTTSSVTVNTLPTASFISTNTTICAGSSTNLQVKFTGAAPWVFTFFDGVTTSSNINAPFNTFDIPVSPVSTTTYTLISVSDNNCTGTITGSPVIISVDAPPVVTLGVSASVSPLCNGGSTTIDVSNSENGVSYQLRKGVTDVGSAVAGNGATINLPTGALGVTTIFNVLATRGVCTPAQLNNTATVTVAGTINSGLTVTPQAATICSGTGTIIQVASSEIGVNYQLRDNSNNANIGSAPGTGGVINLPTGNLSTTTIFNVLATNGTCSVQLTNLATVNVEINPNPGLAVGALISPLCNGGSTSVTIAGSEIGVSYQLRDNATNNPIGGPAIVGTGATINLPTGNLAATTTFNVLATSGAACAMVQLTNTVTVTVAGSIDASLAVTPQAPSVCTGSATNIQVANSEAGVNYQLRDNATNANINGIVAGNGSSIDLPTLNLTTSTTFNVLASNGTCSIQITMLATVNVDINPNIGLATAATLDPVCTGGSSAITVANSETGVSYQLRDASNTNVGSPVIGTGGTINLPTSALASTATFNVFATSGVCGSVQLTSTVTINVGGSLNTALTITPVPSSVCSGSSAIIQIANSELGVDYQLMDNLNNPVGSPVSGNGSIIGLLISSLTSTTTFNILASNGTCSVQMATTPTVTVTGGPNTGLGVAAQNSAVCNGTSTNIQVFNSEIGVSYQLRNNANNSVIGLAVAGTGGTINLSTLNLAASTTFNVLATNGSSCSAQLTSTATVNVLLPSDPLCSGAGGINCGAFTISAADTRPTCSGQDDGTITINVSGGTPNYTVTLSDPVGGFNQGLSGPGPFTFINLSASLTYTYTITDGTNNCTLPYSLPIQTNLHVTPSAFVDAKCFNQAVGQATITVTSGGTSPYEYSLDAGTTWTSFTSPATITNLMPALTAYSILVRDDASDLCPAQVSVTINNAVTDITATFTSTDASCSNNDGTIQVGTVSGGTSPYTYRLDSVDFAALPANSTFTGLAGGLHKFTVIDANGCSKYFKTTINFPGLVNFSTAFTNPDCFASGTNGSVVATITSSGTFDVGITTDPINDPTVFQTIVSAGFSQATFSGLSQGTYFVVAKPVGALCPSRSAPIIIGGGPVAVDFTLIPEDFVCFETKGIVRITNIKGSTVVNYNYEIILAGTIIQSGIITPLQALPPDTINYTDLDKGNYQMRLYQDQSAASGCASPVSSAYKSFSIHGPAASLDTLYVNRKFSLSNIATGSMFIGIQESQEQPYQLMLHLVNPHLQGQKNNYAFDSTWVSVTRNNQNLVMEFNAANIYGGDYRLSIRDTVGCTRTYDLTLDFDQEVYIPNVFTPNNDGKNDTFQILNLPADSKLVITNRWGKEVYHASNYQNNWNGGAEVDGVYYYNLVAGGKTYTGWVEIMHPSY